MTFGCRQGNKKHILKCTYHLSDHRHLLAPGQHQHLLPLPKSAIRHQPSHISHHHCSPSVSLHVLTCMHLSCTCHICRFITHCRAPVVRDTHCDCDRIAYWKLSIDCGIVDLTLHFFHIVQGLQVVDVCAVYC